MDRICPYNTFVRREEWKPKNYKDTTWLYVLLWVHELKVGDPTAAILDKCLQVAYYYADGWGMDHFNFFCHLTFKKHVDLAAVADHYQKIGDMCWLVQEAARRDKESSLSYWRITLRLYIGPDGI